jgi:hypothetical protein
MRVGDGDRFGKPFVWAGGTPISRYRRLKHRPIGCAISIGRWLPTRELDHGRRQPNSPSTFWRAGLAFDGMHLGFKGSEHRERDDRRGHASERNHVKTRADQQAGCRRDEETRGRGESANLRFVTNDDARRDEADALNDCRRQPRRILGSCCRPHVIAEHQRQDHEQRGAFGHKRVRADAGRLAAPFALQPNDRPSDERHDNSLDCRLLGQVAHRPP